MTRLALLLLLSAPLTLTGCGEEERSRVIPVTNETPKSTPEARLPADLTTLKKIPMH